MATTTTVVLPILLGTLAIALMGVVRRGVMKRGQLSPLQYLIVTFASATAAFGFGYIFVWG